MKKINNNKNINMLKKKYKGIIIDKRMIPLFKTPIILKILSDEKKNKYTRKMIKQRQKIGLKKFTVKGLFRIFVKALKLYTYGLKNSAIKYSYLFLILELNQYKKYNKILKLNSAISNYLYIMNKYFPFFNLRSLIFRFSLFLPKQLFKVHFQPCIKYYYKFNKIAKIYRIRFWMSVFPWREEPILKNRLMKLKIKGITILKQIYIKIRLNKKKIHLLKNNNTNKTKNYLKIINSLFNNNINIINNNNNKKKIITNKNLNTKIIKTLENVNNSSKELLLIGNKLVNNNISSLVKNKTNNTNNYLKIEQTIRSIIKNKAFDIKQDAISTNSNPVDMHYYPQKSYTSFFLKDTKKPIINQYLKAISIFNTNQKGVILSYYNIMGFNFNSKSNKLIKNIYTLLARSFKSMYCLISKPVFVMTPDKIIIQLFYFLFIPNILKFKKIFKYGKKIKMSRRDWFKRKFRMRKQYRNYRKIKLSVRIKLRKLSKVVITKVFADKFKLLCYILSHFFKKPVHLDLIRLHYPYNDSNILVNLLGIMVKKIKLRIIFRKLFEKAIIKNINKVTDNTNFNIIPAFLSGINIRVAGRLLTQRVIPRKTVKTIRRGAAATGKINLSDKARITKKNKRGSFSITVSSGQNLFN